MKQKTKEFLLALINKELEAEYYHLETNKTMFNNSDEIATNYIKDLLNAKIDLLSNAKGLDIIVNSHSIQEDLKRFGYTTKNLK